MIKTVKQERQKQHLRLILGRIKYIVINAKLRTKGSH